MPTKLAAVDRFYLGCLNRFLTLLKSTGEEGGNLLDHTTVIYGSGMNNGDRGGHSQRPVRPFGDGSRDGAPPPPGEIPQYWQRLVTCL